MVDGWLEEAGMAMRAGVLLVVVILTLIGPGGIAIAVGWAHGDGVLGDGVLGDGGFSELVVFGDSLSDNGNLYGLTGGEIPMSPPYWEGRFSNGAVWVEHFAEGIGIPLDDRAYGGSFTSDVLLQQVTPYVTFEEVSPDALYTIWAGPNDFLDSEVDPFLGVINAMEHIGMSVALLAAAGAEHFLIPNLPDLGLVPSVTETGDPEFIADATTLSTIFNAALVATIELLEDEYSLEILEMDAFGLSRDLVANPGRYGLVNVTERALSEDGSIVANPDEYLFWDGVHPTRVVHELFADLAIATVAEPGGLALALFGAGMISRRRRVCDRNGNEEGAG
jgi:phospholipase/lecithinase/hemolysin